MFGWAILRNYSTNNALSEMFTVCLDAGIDSVEATKHYTKVSFSNGYVIEFWTSNRMYAYASEGKVRKPDGTESQWNGCMPSRSVNSRLKAAVSTKSFL